MDIHNFPKLIIKIENVDRSITKAEVGSIIKSLWTKRNPGLDGFTAKFIMFHKLSRTFNGCEPFQTNSVKTKSP